jgi:hypothetical protein
LQIAQEDQLLNLELETI